MHDYTARIITDAGEETSRQEAKAHTFAPLYGATGFGRSTCSSYILQTLHREVRGDQVMALPIG